MRPHVRTRMRARRIGRGAAIAGHHDTRVEFDRCNRHSRLIAAPNCVTFAIWWTRPNVRELTMRETGQWRDGVTVVRTESLDTAMRGPSGTGRATAFDFTGTGARY